MRCAFLLFILFICQSQVPVSKTGSKVSAADAKAALEFHNKVRKEVGVPELQWSKELAAYAQQWAEHLAIECKMKHRPNSGEWVQQYGENIFWGSNVYTVVDASRAWYSEKKDFTGPVFTGHEPNVVGHYTQMVWRDSKKVGMGIATCKSGAIIIVANYDPRGNYMGYKAY
jgi:pathogenesis-related protein 1